MAHFPHLHGLLYFMIAIVQYISGHITAVLDESVNIPAHEACTTQGKLVFMPENSSPVTVASFDNGVCTPGEKYGNQVEMSPSGILLTRVNYNDNGVYELTCGRSAPSYIKLEVLSSNNISVPKGNMVKFPCYSLTLGEPVKAVWWEKNKTDVLKLNVSNGEITYGPGFDGRASLSSDWKSTGDLSLTLDGVQVEDEGDYSCFVFRDKKERVNPAVERLTVHDAETPSQPSTCPLWTTPSIIVTVLLSLAIPCAVLLGRKLKSCKPPVWCPCDQQEAGDETMQTNNNSLTERRHLNGFTKQNGESTEDTTLYVE